MWPDSFVRFGLISPKNLFIKWAYNIEKKIYEKADRIIFTFEGGIDYLKERKWITELGGKIDTKKVNYINNGVNIAKFNKDKELYRLEDKDLSDDNYFKIIYLGSIRLVNNIKQLVDAAKILQENTRYKFLIYGDGSDRDYLKKYCIENNISNVIFKEKRIPLKYVPYILSKSSLNILNYKKDFGVYGISSGKLFQYLASSKPICSNIKMNYCLITKYNLGIAKQFENSQEYAYAIRAFGEMDNRSYSAMCKRVNEVVNQFDYNVLSEKLIQVVNNL